MSHQDPMHAVRRANRPPLGDPGVDIASNLAPASIEVTGNLAEDTVIAGVMDIAEGDNTVAMFANLIFLTTPDLHVVATPAGHDPTLATITGTHTYSQPGTYRVRITVTDQAGQTDHLIDTLTVERNPS